MRSRGYVHTQLGRRWWTKNNEGGGAERKIGGKNTGLGESER